MVGPAAPHPGALAALLGSEVLLASSCSPASSQRGVLLVTDPAAPSHAPLLHFKGSAHTAPELLSCVGSATHAAGDAGTSGVLAVMEQDKAVLLLYTWQRDQPAARIVLPHKMACLALSPCGTFLAAGAGDGRLFVWHVSTGALVCTFEAHYRALSVLRWTSDAAALVTAGADARVCVWSLPGIAGRTDLGSVASADVPSPYATFSDHTLPVTDLVVTPGRFPHSAQLWSASADASVKLWDLGTRRLVSTFQLPLPVSRLAVDPLERFFFAAAEPAAAERSAETDRGARGRAYRVDLYAPADAPHAWRARGGRGVEGELERLEAPPCAFVNHAVTAMTLTLAGSHVALGTAAGQVHLVDVSTLQVQRTISAGAAPGAATPATPVTNLVAMLRPVDLMSSLQLRDTAATARRGAPVRDAVAAASTAVAPLPARSFPSQFARSLAPEAPAPVMLRAGAGAGANADALHRYLSPVPGTAQPAMPSAPAAGAAAPVADASPALQAEVHELRQQLERAKSLNDGMWRRLVQHTMGS